MVHAHTCMHTTYMRGPSIYMVYSELPLQLIDVLVGSDPVKGDGCQELLGNAKRVDEAHGIRHELAAQVVDNHVVDCVGFGSNEVARAQEEGEVLVDVPQGIQRAQETQNER
eukprot:GEZU01029158.1.p1 GENE.GEZU01029158.1~~GEZU01029158.1.p1  ORF type:complete len:112 (+),score=11.54 GEZU01029158.1:6-341(+)